MGRPELSSPTLRVGFYSDAERWAGAEIALATLLASLGSHIQATVIGTSAEIVGRLVEHRPRSRAEVLRPSRGVGDVRAILEHRRSLRSLDLHVLQANLTWAPSCREALIAATTLPGLSTVAVEHLPLPDRGRRNRLVKRFTSRRLDAHVAVGRQAARLVEIQSGLPEGTVRTIYNGMPDPGPPAQRTSHDGPVVIGCLARLDPVKGLDLLVRAVARLPDCRLVLAGEGEQREALHRLASDLGMKDRLSILGWTDDPASLLSTFDIFALPSRAEGFPLSIIEAMLTGLPVVASDVGSVREAVTEGETGLVVPPGDVDAVGRALGALVADAPRRAAMGRAGRRRAEAAFTATRMAANYESLYAELLSGPTTRWRLRRPGPGGRPRTIGSSERSRSATPAA